MTHPTLDRSLRTPTMWLGLLWFLAVTLAGSMARRWLAPDGTLLVGALYALGTVGMAWITMRRSRYPTLAWVGTSSMMALALLVSALVTPPSAQKGLTELGWMFPFLFLCLGSTPAPRTGWCAPGSAWSGWLLFGTGSVYTTLLLTSTWTSFWVPRS